MPYDPQQLPRVDNRFALTLSPQRWLAIFCFMQILLWTLGSWAVRYNMVYDTMESYVWGLQWQWGYDKHPPFTAWMTAIFGKLFSTPAPGIYLLAQLCIVATFLCVWRLAREYLDNRGSVLAVFMLTGVLHYSNRVERVTPDTMQSPIWALLALSFYFAVEKQSLRFWVISGILAGIGFLTKYQLPVLLIPMAVALLWSDKRSETIRSAGPWVASILAIAIASPHIVWLFDNNFPALQYLDDRYISDEAQSWLRHLITPAEFALNSLGYVSLLPLVCWPLFKAPKYYHAYSDTRKSFKRAYIYALALGPVTVSLIFGAINGSEMVPRWSTPYFAWLPLLILVWLNREISPQVFRKILISSFILALTLWSLRTGYLYYKPYITTDYWRADEFTPANKSMAKAEAFWNERYSTPLPYLGGSHYHVMALTAYSSEDTVPFSNLREENSLWMKESDFRKKGGIIVLEKNINDIQDKTVTLVYPSAEFLGTIHFRPHVPEDIENPTPSIVSYYLLPPAASSKPTQLGKP